MRKAPQTTRKTPAQKLSEYLGHLYNYVRGGAQAPRCQVDEEQLMADVLACIRGYNSKKPPAFLATIQELLKEADQTLVFKTGRTKASPKWSREVLDRILVCVSHHWGLRGVHRG